MRYSETAYAKVNLALHVRGRRNDGYHAIETLFAFVDEGDLLSVEEAAEDSLTIEGAFADGLVAGPDNLVLRALSLARELGAVVPPLAIGLEKNLPVAAGLGGGSADAGAMLRLIMREWGAGSSENNVIAASVALGADVPACVRSKTMFARGIGNEMEPIDLGLARQPILLVNPLLPCPTAPVFAAWDGVDRGALDTINWRKGRNDLTEAALSLCPEIDDVMTVLRAQLP
ncbi:MAG: 4-(cytidine 5'-diphospho)-2-C-methyl-D-erythritol kinase, partial [Sphingopyxis sp.]